jgi:hypothetical protein
MRFLLYAVPLVVVLYSLIDCLLTDRLQTRTLPKWLWLVVIVLVPLLGAVGWLLAGRPARSQDDPVAAASGARGLGARRRQPVAPDDDPAFLRKLSDEEWSRKMRERREGTEGLPPQD